jgi:hypothetical protein
MEPSSNSPSNTMSLAGTRFLRTRILAGHRVHDLAVHSRFLLGNGWVAR